MKGDVGFLRREAVIGVVEASWSRKEIIIRKKNNGARKIEEERLVFVEGENLRFIFYHPLLKIILVILKNIYYDMVFWSKLKLTCYLTIQVKSWA